MTDCNICNRHNLVHNLHRRSSSRHENCHQCIWYENQSIQKIEQPYVKGSLDWTLPETASAEIWMPLLQSSSRPSGLWEGQSSKMVAERVRVSAASLDQGLAAAVVGGGSKAPLLLPPDSALSAQSDGMNSASSSRQPEPAAPAAWEQAIDLRYQHEAEAMCDFSWLDLGLQDENENEQEVDEGEEEPITAFERPVFLPSITTGRESGDDFYALATAHNAIQPSVPWSGAVTTPFPQPHRQSIAAAPPPVPSPSSDPSARSPSSPIFVIVDTLTVLEQLFLETLFDWLVFLRSQEADPAFPPDDAAPPLWWAPEPDVRALREAFLRRRSWDEYEEL